MSKVSFTIRALALVGFALAFTSLAQAQATRTWVSGVGDDVNPCSRTAPCKTFAGAISKTAANGEIDALDPGGFGAVTITKSITIEGSDGGGFGSILASLVNGVIINDVATGSPNTIVVTLRNLSINGAGNGFNGVRFLSGAALNVEDCQIFGFRGGSGHGIEVALSAGNNQQVTVKNTHMYNNLGSGIRATHSFAGSVVRVTLNNVKSERNGNGALFENGTAGIITNSQFSYNTAHGLSITAGFASFNAHNCVITQNTTNGVNATAGTARLSSNYIVGNLGSGVNSPAGQAQTFGNNIIKGNVTDVTGTLTAVPVPTFQ
ncbi:MAG TPA: right-handed parallel beta-helix repeat-containing protein [Pyrinomonadaceae bacterium]|nr:right-handed parallel beta-helix repeat-containing protein [Pyrinomonadaceae bacterium]